MNNPNLLKKLEALIPLDDLESQEKIINWTIKVESLLKKHPNKKLYKDFTEFSKYFIHNMSECFNPNLLKNIQDYAFNEMKHTLKKSI